jgi:hypothetical protein
MIASFDNAGAVPQQVWYDQLRESDDGRFVHKGEEFKKKRVVNTNSQKKIDMIN